MRHQRLGALVGCAAVALFAGAAHAQSVDQGYFTTEGPYVGAAGGGSFLNDVSPSGAGADTKSQFDPGYIGLGDVGWSFGNGFRAEIEGGYFRNDVRGVRGSLGANKGALGVTTVMLNGLYDFDLTQWGVDTAGFIPHLGIGVGWARPRFDNAGYYNGGVLSGKDDVLAYQGIAGIGYAITPNLKVDLDYRYYGTDRAQFNVADGTTGISRGTAKASIQDQQVLLGIRYEFGEPPAPPPPAPVPAPAAAPAPAPETQRAFQVFFDFNKSNITAAAAKVIRQAAASVRQGNLTRITVTGHTDTVGSARYNQGLSERRADAVKRQLIADGVAGNEITTVGVGKTGLLVPTGDGVREPQNRRAEIVLQ